MLTMFKPPWRWFIDVELIIGDPQINLEVAKTPSQALQKYFENINPSSEMGIISYNFSKREWDQNFCDWLRKLHQNKVKIKVVGGPEIRAKENLEKLIGDGIIELRILEKPTTFHIVYATDPKQLWVEQYHGKGYPKGIHYTDNPFDENWKEYLKMFNYYWEKGQTWKIKN